MMATSLPNLYVTADPRGQFRFYSYTDTGFINITDVEEKDVTVTCSFQKLPARLYYIEQDGAKLGHGLFTTALYPQDDVRLYDYAFFRMTDMPQGYGNADALLLVDFDEDDFARADKTYSEVFSLNLSSGKTELLTSENGRTVDNKARMRTDWAQLNDALLRFGGDKLYLSGRNYQLDSKTADIIRNTDTSRTKPTLIDTAGLCHTQLSDCLQNAQHAYGIDIGGELRGVKAYLYMALCCEVVDFRRLHLANDPQNAHGVAQVCVVQMEMGRSLYMSDTLAKVH